VGEIEYFNIMTRNTKEQESFIHLRQGWVFWTKEEFDEWVSGEDCQEVQELQEIIYSDRALI
jgi:putative SOS response-associated peptidase YedK